VAVEEINITELRQKLPAYIEQVRKGKELKITVRGKVVARLVPTADEGEAARRWLSALRKSGKVHIGDVVSPAGEQWEAASGDP
jgi:prevent-host-death family protein